MALGHGAKIVTDGLVFAYDMENTIKSWKGAPTTNVVTNTNLDTGWSKDYNTSILYNDYPPPIGIDSQVVSFIDADGNGSGYWYSYGDYAPQNPSTTYCISVWVRTIGNGFTLRAYTANNSETGRQFTNELTCPGDGQWHRLEFNPITTPSNTTSDSLSFQFTSIPANQRCWLCAPQMTASSIHYPFVAGTRSNTQALLDWTGNHTITASSLTYNSDGTFSFNGSSNYVSSSSVSLGGDPIVTVNQWIRRTANFSNGGYWGLGGGSTNNGINGYTSVTNKIGWDLWGQTTFHTGQDYPLNQWVNVCWVKTATTFTTSTLKIYINGAEFPLTTTVRNNSSTVNLRDSITIGRIADNINSYYAPGNIGGTQVYNRALTAAEIQRNFTATRSRYGI